MEELYREIEEKIALSREEYEEYKSDVQWSVTVAKKLEAFEHILSLLKKGQSPEALLADLKEELPGMEEERDREAIYPSFDWYDEHYHYKILEGWCIAYKEVIKLLEKERP